MNPLLDQAARVLDHQPTRSMEAEPLYRKAVRESGHEVPYARFIEALRRQPDRFAVIEPDPVCGLSRSWDARHRSLYRAALEAAGLARPIVLLAERLRDPLDAGEAECDDAGPAAVLGDIHESLTHLLHTADDESLYDAVASAVEELQVLKRVLVPSPADLTRGAG